MSILKIILRFNFTLLLISIVMVASAFSQPPGGGNQPQMGQNNQTGQGGPGGGMMQGGPGGQMGQSGQTGSQTQQGQGAGFARGQGMTSEQMQTAINQRLKEQLGCSDEEWKVIGPKVLKVYTLTSSQSRGLQMRSLLGRSNNQSNNQGSNQGNAQGTATPNRASNITTDKTMEELQTLLQNQNATNAQIKKQLTEVRNSREKTQEELAKAQKELRELLTLKQEAILVSIGLLE
jgi:hypothetical protein